MSVEDLVSQFAKNISKKPSSGWRRADTYGEPDPYPKEWHLVHRTELFKEDLDEGQIKEHQEELFPFFEAVADEVEKIYIDKGVPKYEQVKIKTDKDGGKYKDYRSPIVRIEEEGSQNFAVDFQYRLQNDLLSNYDEWDDLRRRLMDPDSSKPGRT